MGLLDEALGRSLWSVNVCILEVSLEKVGFHKDSLPSPDLPSLCVHSVGVDLGTMVGAALVPTRAVVTCVMHKDGVVLLGEDGAVRRFGLDDELELGLLRLLGFPEPFFVGAEGRSVPDWTLPSGLCQTVLSKVFMKT